MQKTGLFTWFFALYAVFGFIALPDYGVPLDELTQRNIGIENNRFITGRIDDAALSNNGLFGPAFESAMYLVEQLYYNADLGFKIYVRHFVLFAIFLMAIWCFYSLSKRLFRNQMVAGTTASLFALYPPLFAHAHYNSKDTLFLSVLIFVLWFIVRFFETKNFKLLIIAALFSGLSVTLRMHGIFIVMSVAAGFMFRKELSFKQSLLNFGSYLAVTAAAFYLFFPWLWTDTLNHVLQIMHYVSANPWPNDVWFAGKWFSPNELPYAYLPFWLFVSIPAAVIVLFLIGLVVLLLKPIYRSSSFVIMLLLLLVLPILAYSVFKPVMYDGWRHWQFLTVPLFFISGFALEWAMDKLKSKNLLWILSGYSAVGFMLWHPYGYVYMNEIYAAAFPPNSFTQDYWGLSSNQMLNHVLKHDSSDKINIYSFTEAASHNSLMFGAKERQRLRFVSKKDSAHYIIDIRRGPTFDSAGQEIFVLCPMKDTISRLIKVER